MQEIPSKREQRRTALLKEIEAVYRASSGRYGSPRITKELHMKGIQVSKVLVAKIMKRHHLKSIVRKRYKITTNSSHKYPVVANALNRNFTTTRPNAVWVPDITYINTQQGWLYLTTVIDLFDRKVIGWSLSNTMNAISTSIAAFKMAKHNRPIKQNQPLIFHSDRGIQYACDEFTTLLNAYSNIVRSMSRKGNCWDNAVAESFFKTLKTELVYHHVYQTKQQAELSVFEYIETFYNTKRRHQQLNHLNINEHKLLFYNHLKNAA